MAADRRLRRLASLGAHVALLALGAVVACDAPTWPADEAAYDPTALTGGRVYRWALGRTIAVFVDTTASGVVGIDLVRATQAGIAAWNAVPRYHDYELRLAARPTDADVIVRWRDAPPLVDLRGCGADGGGSGRTTFCVDSSPAPVLPLLGTGGGRVKVDVYVDGFAVPPGDLTPVQYAQALVTHELGHVLGIGGHSDAPGDVMRPGPMVLAPSPRDVRTLRTVWRAPADLLL